MISMLSNANRVLIDTIYNDNKLKRIYLEKTYFPSKNTNHYFLKLYSIGYNGTLICEGYIYFYLDELTKESSFIGLYVKPEYRSAGIASLLVSYWLKTCMDNGYYKFTTNKRQRKPFLLYLLKKMGFEIEDETKYSLSYHTISLYQSPTSTEKYLQFKHEEYAIEFMKSNIAGEDNYSILPSSSDEFIYLDQVLLSNIYTLKDENKAYTRSRRKIESYK